MNALKPIAIAVCVYVGVVFAFETLIGVFQPTNESTLVLTTRDRDGNTNERVLTRLESGGQLYVAANHWPRRWYHRVLEHPEVEIALEGETGAYRAVPVAGAEHDRVNEENDTGVVFRILTGFPPRKFVRLDPR